MNRFVVIVILIVVFALVAWLRTGERKAVEPVNEPAAAMDAALVEEEDSRELAKPTPELAKPAPELAKPTLFGHPLGLTLEQQDELRQPELIQNVPAEVLEHARSQGFPFEGRIVAVVADNGFWLVAHDPIDAFMWAAENRPIHPEDPGRLLDFRPGDTVRGTIFHGQGSYILRLP